MTSNVTGILFVSLNLNPSKPATMSLQFVSANRKDSLACSLAYVGNVVVVVLLNHNRC